MTSRRTMNKRELRDQRRAKGLCIDCGKEPAGKYWRGLKCRRKINARRAARKARQG